MKFLRRHLGLSQEKFAQELGIKRGRLAPYEDKSSGDPEFYKLIVEKYDINLHKFLIVEMNDRNYQSFFTTDPTHVLAEDEQMPYFNKSKIIDLIQQLKEEPDQIKRGQMADEAVALVARLMEENNDLQKEVLLLLKKGQ